MRILLTVLLLLSSQLVAANVTVQPGKTLLNKTITVLPGKTVGYRLTLPKGSTLHAKYIVSGGLNHRLSVWMTDARNYRLYINKQDYRVYSGATRQVKHRNKTKFVVSRAGDYYLMFDNRKSFLLKRTVDAYIYVVYNKMDPQSLKLQTALQKTYDALRKHLKFKPFNIHVRYCGFANAYSDPNIHMCRELQDSLIRQGVSSAWTFIFFHELGHSLVRLWGIPGHGNEDIADEFAAYTLLSANQEKTLKSAALWFLRNSSRQEALYKLANYDRHTLKAQRARNVLIWIKQKNDLIRRWNRLLVPRMTNFALQEVVNSPKEQKGYDMGQVRKELRSRDIKSTGEIAKPVFDTKRYLREAISLAAAHRTAIEVAVSEGYKLGSLPRPPAKLGLRDAYSYHSIAVINIDYAPSGDVTITLRKDSRLGKSAGKTIVISPNQNGLKLSWEYSVTGTLNYNLLPKVSGIYKMSTSRPE